MKIMRGKFVLFVALGVLLISTGSARAATTLKKLGSHSFDKHPLITVQDLQRMIEARQADLVIGFQKAGEPALFEAFKRQFVAAHIKTVEFQPGERLQWMLFRKAKKVRVLRDVTGMQKTARWT